MNDPMQCDYRNMCPNTFDFRACLECDRGNLCCNPCYGMPPPQQCCNQPPPFYNQCMDAGMCPISPCAPCPPCPPQCPPATPAKKSHEKQQKTKHARKKHMSSVIVLYRKTTKSLMNACSSNTAIALKKNRHKTKSKSNQEPKNTRRREHNAPEVAQQTEQKADMFNGNHCPNMHPNAYCTCQCHNGAYRCYPNPPNANMVYQPPPQRPPPLVPAPPIWNCMGFY